MIIAIFTLIVLLFSVIIHEIAHGSVAYYLGDPTAKQAGRLTLNPLKHLDLFGSIILPLALFFSYSISGGAGPIIGWAKPVPINPYNFRDPQKGILKVSIAGPSMNFLIALFFGLLIRFIPLSSSLTIFFTIISVYNFAWAVFNLTPIPPFDGFHILFTLLPEKFSEIKFFLQEYGLIVLLFFILFGLKWVFWVASFLFSITTGQSFVI